MPKRARVSRADIWEVTCPYCDTCIDNQGSGSQMWEIDDFEKLSRAGRLERAEVSCGSCGKIVAVAIPKAAR